jgi:HAD superfamily hydrolase (TIGR01458 family)
MKNLKGFLIDLDGVMYTGDHPIAGAKETIEFFRERNYAIRFVSNTTRKSRQSIAMRLANMGLDISENTIFTPARAAVTFMKKTGKRNCFLLVTNEAKEDFDPFCTSQPEENADFVVIGDAGERITYDSMTIAFRHLIEGAELIALEKDRYWMAADGLSLSAGPFVAALEFATGKTATIVGKPSGDFFRLALNDMELQPGEVAMIGDDIRTDIGGAMNIGIRGILVRTGKFREENLQDKDVVPDQVIDSIRDLPSLIGAGSCATKRKES